MENPAAFPALNYVVPSDLHAEGVRRLGETQGMTLRDCFAASCCKGAADAVCDNLSEDGEDKAREHAARHAKAAYLIADAMLKARKDQG